MKARSKKLGAIVSLTAAGVMWGLVVITYTTNLFSVVVTGNSGFEVSGGQNPYENITRGYPHLLGPYFIIGAVAMMVIGILLIYGLRKN